MSIIEAAGSLGSAIVNHIESKTTAQRGFGVRDPRDWGLSLSAMKAEENSAAIEKAIASLSGQQGTVIIPPGDYFIARPIRLDGKRIDLNGSGWSATRLRCVPEFDVSDPIYTDDYPDGFTPAIEIGCRIDPNKNSQDEGFSGGVSDIGIMCPHRSPNRIGGIGWHGCALQEGTRIRRVIVQNHGGYAIGGPRKQRLSANSTPLVRLMQLNGVIGSQWWIFSPNPNFDDVIGVSIGGLTYHIDTATVDNGRASGAVQTKPAVIANSFEGGMLSNFHIEMSPKSGAQGVGVLIPHDGTNIVRMTLTNICYRTALPWRPENNNHRTLKITAKTGHISCRSISCMLGSEYGRAIEDVHMNKTVISSGFHHVASSSSVASYDRQSLNHNTVNVLTSDPALELK